MYKAIVNGKESFQVDSSSTTADIIALKANDYHVLKDGKSFNVAVLEHDKAAKTCTLRINGNTYTVQLKTSIDLLLEKMGISNLSSPKISAIKAPMPGLVLQIMVQAGDNIVKGDALLILEAMKMENVLKAPADGVVKAIKVKAGEAVEKNQVLIALD